MLICDEPVSALDVSVQAQVVNLMERLQDELGLSYIFIAHDLSVVRHISDRVGVMYLGKMAELGDEDQVYSRPTHPYTQALLSAVPVPDPTLREKREQIVLKGDVPSPANPPSGCRFRTRCFKAQDKCKVDVPELILRPDGLDRHLSACHFAAPREIIETIDVSAIDAPTGGWASETAAEWAAEKPSDRHTSVSVPPSPLWGGRHGALGPAVRRCAGASAPHGRSGMPRGCRRAAHRP